MQSSATSVSALLFKRRRALDYLLLALVLCFMLSTAYLTLRIVKRPAASAAAAVESPPPPHSAAAAAIVVNPSVAADGASSSRCQLVTPIDVTANLVSTATLGELAKLDVEINSGWNFGGTTRVLVVGVTGYVKRDLPIYELAFRSPSSSKSIRFEIVRHPLPQKKTVVKPAATYTAQDFDTVLCLSFNTDYCLLSSQFGSIVPRNKKINRINHLRPVIWGKHSFCNTLSQATRGFVLRSPSEAFYFPCWVLPEQYDELQRNALGLKRWISKPRGLGAGMGISVVDDLREISPRSTHVIQEYMERPFLLKQKQTNTMHKWDMRTYVLVTSVLPVRAYLFQRGLVRFAMTPYSADCKSNSQTACLTNTSINKKIGVGAAKDITWPFSELKREIGPAKYASMMERIQRGIGMTLLAAQPEFFQHSSSGGGQHCESCYQLLGVDVIVDADLTPKVIEVNGEPSMQLTAGKASASSSSHYDTTKKLMIQNVVDLVFQPESAAKHLRQVVQQRCGGGAPQQLRKHDAAYLLDLHREHVARGEFDRIYPAPAGRAARAGTFRRFLHHMSTSPQYGKATQARMKDLVRAHDVFAQLLPEEPQQEVVDEDEEVKDERQHEPVVGGGLRNADKEEEENEPVDDVDDDEEDNEDDDDDDDV